MFQNCSPSHFHVLVETVYGLEYRDSDRVDPRGDISQLMRFYVFIAFMVVSRLVWNVVKAHTGSDMFFSITHSSISESLESTLSIVYCGVIASHTAMLNKKYFGNYFGFVDEIADAFGSLPSPPRVKRSFLAITTSYLTSSLYLTVLVLAIMGINIILTENNIPKIPSTSFLWPFLYFLGFFLCTYQVFSVRTNLAMLVFWAQIMACRFLPTLFCGLVYNMNIASNSTRSGERVTGSSVISPLTVASTAFVETDTGSNLTTQDDQGSAGSNTRLASTDAPGIINIYDYSSFY